MKPAAETHLAAAKNEIHRLRILAQTGDASAVEALRDLGLFAVDQLDNLRKRTPGIPPEIPRNSTRWPAAYEAIAEHRADAWKRIESLAVGANLGIRLAGKNRGMEYTAQAGFANDLRERLETMRRNPEPWHWHPADLHPELAAPGILTRKQLHRSWQNLAVKLPPLTKDSLRQWADAALELCRDDCEGDFEAFPWPDFIKNKMGSGTGAGNALRSGESAVKGKILSGFKSLI